MVVSSIPMVLIYVSDVKASVEWYQQIFDLPVLYQDDSFATLQVGAQRLALHGSSTAGEGDRHSGGMPVFEVSDYAETRATLEDRGCEFYFENQTPNAIFASFTDPDGNALQIMQSLSAE